MGHAVFINCVPFLQKIRKYIFSWDENVPFQKNSHFIYGIFKTYFHHVTFINNVGPVTFFLKKNHLINYCVIQASNYRSKSRV